MTSIDRNPDRNCSERYDLIVVGGGIHGCCLSLEAARRGIKVLLLEREDYGGATSWNSLRIVHGGLRYLQHADFSRFRRSVAEQAWWLTTFPQLVVPLPCLMPLYDRGLRRRSVMRVALTLNDWMVRSVRRGLGYGDLPLHDGHIINADQTIERFPLVDRSGLRGAAVWHDARMTSPQRLLIEVLRWASACGAKALNYMECTNLIQRRGRVSGVCARCGVTNRDFEFEAEYVINCAGPWAADIMSLGGAKIGGDAGLAMAFNLIVHRRPLADDAVAVTAQHSPGTTYFMVPHGDRTIIGTAHVRDDGCSDPTETQISQFIDELNGAIPEYQLSRSEVAQVLSGRMPAAQTGSHVPSKSPQIIHHRSKVGPVGMTSVIGVKYTTARHLAERTLREIWSSHAKDLPEYTESLQPELAVRPDLTSHLPAVHDLQAWIQSESVVHVDDLLLRRCDLGLDEKQRFQLAADILKQTGWHNPISEELNRLREKTALDALRPRC